VGHVVNVGADWDAVIAAIADVNGGYVLPYTFERPLQLLCVMDEL